MELKRFVTHGTPHTSYMQWYNKDVTYTPLYVNGKFVCNIADAEREQKRKEAAEYLLSLRRNDYKFLAFYSKKDNVFDFLKWVKDNGYNFEPFTRFAKYPDYTDFGGNLREFSAAFSYRIYDAETLKSISQYIRDNWQFTPDTRDYSKEPVNA